MYMKQVHIHNIEGGGILLTWDREKGGGGSGRVQRSAVGGNADNAVFEVDLGAANYQGHLLFSEVGHEMRYALKFMVLRLHLKSRNQNG